MQTPPTRPRWLPPAMQQQITPLWQARLPVNTVIMMELPALPLHFQTPAACPAGGNNCYSVAITYKQQLYLEPVIGFNGDTTVNGQPATTLRASAKATQAPRRATIVSLPLTPSVARFLAMACQTQILPAAIRCPTHRRLATVTTWAPIMAMRT